MRRTLFQYGSGLDEKGEADPWRRRMPTQKYISRESAGRFNTTEQKPLTFGKRKVEPETVIPTRGFTLARLASLFQGPRKTRRTKAR
jgi:hypothetical protein